MCLVRKLPFKKERIDLGRQLVAVNGILLTSQSYLHSPYIGGNRATCPKTVVERDPTAFTV